MREYSTQLDVAYSNATSPRQALDLLLPVNSDATSPLLVYIHGQSRSVPLYSQSIAQYSYTRGTTRWSMAIRCELTLLPSTHSLPLTPHTLQQTRRKTSAQQ
jgi:hypothetical protein